MRPSVAFFPPPFFSCRGVRGARGRARARARAPERKRERAPRERESERERREREQHSATNTQGRVYWERNTAERILQGMGKQVKLCAHACPHTRCRIPNSNLLACVSCTLPSSLRPYTLVTCYRASRRASVTVRVEWGIVLEIGLVSQFVTSMPSDSATSHNKRGGKHRSSSASNSFPTYSSCQMALLLALLRSLLPMLKAETREVFTTSHGKGGGAMETYSPATQKRIREGERIGK